MSDVSTTEHQSSPDSKTPPRDEEKNSQDDASKRPDFLRNTTAGGHPAQDALFAIPGYHRKTANAMPLGMLAQAGTLLLLSLYNAGARGVTITNGAVTVALALGGLTQLLAGCMEFKSGNSYGATVFTSYGFMWWGYAMLYVPFFGLTGTYNSSPGVYTATGTGAEEIGAAFGVFWITWFAISVIFTIASIRSSVAVLAYSTTLSLAFLLQACSYWSPGNQKLLVASGSLGIFSAAAAFYVGLGGLLTKESSYFLLPLGSLRRQEK